MTLLRQRMIDEMRLRNLAPGTQANYLHHMTGLAGYYGLSLDKLDLEAIREYMVYLIEDRKLSAESVNQFASAASFCFVDVLEMPWGREQFPRARRRHRLPVVLSQEEIVQFFDHVAGLRYRAILMTCYGAGLRVSEAVSLKVSGIDSSRMLIRVEQGKGGKDRYVTLSPRLLEVLRTWWRAARPADWLFPGWRIGRHVCAASVTGGVPGSGVAVGAEQEDHRAHAPAQLRDSLARGRHGYPRDPGAARSHQHPHHRSLHGRHARIAGRGDHAAGPVGAAPAADRTGGA